MTNIETQNNWHSDSKNWKYIFFYYNPEDSRLMVSKRSEWAGITFNYAHKMAWFWTIFIFLFVSLLIYFLSN
jgi:uncharacterized membrane protein